MVFAVQQGLPLPERVAKPPPKQRKYPFREMGVGDMFFVPNRERNTLASYATQNGQRLGYKFSTRCCLMKLDANGDWLPTEDEDGVKGIGVWRVE